MRIRLPWFADVAARYFGGFDRIGCKEFWSFLGIGLLSVMSYESHDDDFDGVTISTISSVDFLGFVDPALRRRQTASSRQQAFRRMDSHS